MLAGSQVCLLHFAYAVLAALEIVGPIVSHSRSPYRPMVRSDRGAKAPSEVISTVLHKLVNSFVFSLWGVHPHPEGGGYLTPPPPGGAAPSWSGYTHFHFVSTST